MLWLQLLVYLAVLVFFVAVAARIWKYGSAPVHLRWELYPVTADREKPYGGSYYEEMEWWKDLPKKNLFHELLAMGEEILFLKGVYENNRGLWYFSYPFHLGLYVLVGLLGLLVVGGVAEMLGISVAAGSPSWIGLALHYLTILAGGVGLGLAFLGCIGLLIKRLQDPILKPMTSPADYCNLVYILLLLGVAGAAWLFADPAFATAREIARSLITFQPLPQTSSIVMLEVILFAVFLLYLPFTRMTHFFAKYFTYHQVRWEDSPNLPGGQWEGKIQEVLNFGVSWQAPHVQTGKTWGEVAMEMPQEEQS
jgi:nitrate reductase gamma subunit